MTRCGLEEDLALGSFLRTVAAVAAYGAVHSALLTPAFRLALEALVGPRAARGWFRLGYNALAAVLLAALLAYLARLPDRDIVRVGGVAALGLWAVRLAGLGFILWCVGRVGGGAFLGLDHARACLRGRPVPGDGVEAGDLVVDGPYRHVRHPMYAAGLVVLWAGPVWTVNRLGFALAASAYLWLGALHEERRLARSFGSRYAAYAAGRPRFVPRPGRGR